VEEEMKRRSKSGFIITRGHGKGRLYATYRDPETYTPRPQRREIFKYMISCMMSKNSGKLLDHAAAAGHYFWQERSRGADQSYFRVKIQGNRLVATRFRYEKADGAGANMFLGCDEPVTLVTKTVAERPIRQFDEFIADYIDATPELGWYQDMIVRKHRYQTIS
jgi:hypothetical protein